MIENIETKQAKADYYGLTPRLVKNDKKAKLFIWLISIIVFTVVAVLFSKRQLDVNIGFNPHLFAKINAGINSLVTLILLAALFAVKKQFYALHKRLMIVAIFLSLLFLASYICHHLF